MQEITHNSVPQGLMVLLQKVDSLIEMYSSLNNVKEESSQPHERLTRKEVSDEYKISLGTVDNLKKDGKLSFEKLGRKTLFKRSEVEIYFQSKSKKISSNG
jgi:excisionase family DNA binding protein